MHRVETRREGGKEGRRDGSQREMGRGKREGRGLCCQPAELILPLLLVLGLLATSRTALLVGVTRDTCGVIVNEYEEQTIIMRCRPPSQKLSTPGLCNPITNHVTA